MLANFTLYKNMKLPAFQFYPADWRKDPGVQALSYHDRGVWFEILCLMHESEQRGKLTLNGRPMPEDALARLLGLDKQNLTKVISILLEYGVARRDPVSGVIYNKRMVEDEKLRQIRAEIGQKGGQERVKREKDNLLKQNSSKSLKQGKQNSTPSSSSSITKKEEVEEEKSVAIVLCYFVGDDGFSDLIYHVEQHYPQARSRLIEKYTEIGFLNAITAFADRYVEKHWDDKDDFRTHLTDYVRVFIQKNPDAKHKVLTAPQRLEADYQSLKKPEYQNGKA